MIRWISSYRLITRREVRKAKEPPFQVALTRYLAGAILSQTGEKEDVLAKVQFAADTAADFLR